jgi:glycosyltransferase involved in cell wall biosynthesis
VRGEEVAISVVVPTRNRARFLADCLASLAVQETSVPFDVVVVDNASSDETAEVAARWSSRDGRFRLVREDVLGRAAALNTGMAAARGDLLIFTDDDVFVQPGYVEAYRRFFAQDRDGLVFAGGAIHPVPVDAAWPAWFSPRAARSLIFVDWGAQRRLLPGETVWGGNTAAPRRVFDGLGTWNVEMGIRDVARPSINAPERNEDIEFQERVRAAGGEIWFVADAVVQHRTQIPGPRTCLRSGFATGRNDYNRALRPGRPEDRVRGPRNGRSLAAWASALARYAAWCLTFRLRPRRRAFDRAWFAGWSSGWRMEDLLAGGVHDGFDRTIRRITRTVTRRASLLAPADLAG